METSWYRSHLVKLPLKRRESQKAYGLLFVDTNDNITSMVQKREDVPGREHIESGHSFSWQTLPCSGLREYGTVFTFFSAVNIATH